MGLADRIAQGLMTKKQRAALAASIQFEADVEAALRQKGIVDRAEIVVAMAEAFGGMDSNGPRRGRVWLFTNVQLIIWHAHEQHLVYAFEYDSNTARIYAQNVNGAIRADIVEKIGTKPSRQIVSDVFDPPPPRRFFELLKPFVR